MSTYVAVDGGQSELRLTIVGSGTVHTGPGFVYGGSIVDSVRSAWFQGGPVDRAVLGLSGLPSTVDSLAALATALAELLGAAEVVLCADNVTAHAGALPDGYGVALTVGTGVGCLAAATGVTHRVDGWGHLFGDDGSAFAIGRAGIAAALRALDGRGPATALLDLARGRFDPLPERLYVSAHVVDDTARFAPDVLGAAEAGDAVAAEIVRQAGAELARTAAAGVAALPIDVGLSTPVRSSESGVDRPTSVPVAVTGRLVERGGPLVDAFRDALATACPRARLVPAAGTPLDGACRLAIGLPDVYRPLLYIHRGL